MAIKAGQIIHDAQGFVIDRIQQGGVSNLNIPQEKIYELGNYQTVANIRDTPDLSFDLQSFDVSTEVEAVLLGLDPTTLTNHQGLSFLNAIPTDIISPFKASGAYNVVKGIITPYLTLEQAAYKFGVKSNSEETFTLRGDSIYYVPGTPKFTEYTLVNDTLTYNLANTALPYIESGQTLYVLGACVKNVSTGKYKRLFLNTDYTNTSSSITLLHDHFDDGYTKLHVVWGTATAGTYAQAVHQGVSVKPAAIRGKDIDVYIMDNSLATPAMKRWTGVQSADVTWKVSLQADEEFGNYKYVSQDYDTADVTGSVTIKPADDDDLWAKMRQIANISSSSAIVGPYSSIGLPMEIRISNPDTGTVIKSLYVEDARFTVPNVRGQVQQKLSVQFNFESDGGNLVIYNGGKS